MSNNKKLVIGGVVLLLVVGGGLFLLFGGQPEKPKEQSGSDTIPTQWSQAGDYEIKEVAGKQTVVTNSKAGFSFKVPEGWLVKGESLNEEYSLNLLHPNAKFDKDNFLIDGCFISIETVTQRDKITNINVSIDDLLDNLDSRPDQKVIRIGRLYALQTSIISSVISDNPEIIKKIRDMIRIEIPIDEENIVDLELILKKSFVDQCTKTLDQLLLGDFFF